MSLTLEQARELCEQALQEKKKQRKARVDDLVSNSKSPEYVEAYLRKIIIAHPEEHAYGLSILDVVTNDWNDPDRDKIRSEVQEELVKKYGQLFEGCVISELPCGNNAMRFHLTMRM